MAAAAAAGSTLLAGCTADAYGAAADTARAAAIAAAADRTSATARRGGNVLGRCRTWSSPGLASAAASRTGRTGRGTGTASSSTAACTGSDGTDGDYFDYDSTVSTGCSLGVSSSTASEGHSQSGGRSRRQEEAAAAKRHRGERNTGSHRRRRRRLLLVLLLRRARPGGHIQGEAPGSAGGRIITGSHSRTNGGCPQGAQAESRTDEAGEAVEDRGGTASTCQGVGQGVPQQAVPGEGHQAQVQG